MARTEIDRADARFGWMMAAPALATLFLVILFPVLWALFTSVHDYTLINPHFDNYSGLANFRRAITDPEFRTASVSPPFSWWPWWCSSSCWAFSWP